ncbi:MAG: 23S rRNA (pseudouridine(1915)-N(3))-methyltransferase RlmH [Saprospiraceae bacterium]|nr:23S rRNA (pseudouridine(1915)-N(3))-methyltransferase RlmH [Saprospiraceae bacterium]
MKVELWAIGKTNERYLEEGMALYEKRLKHYLPFQWSVVPDIKGAGSLSAQQVKAKEGESILSKLKDDDLLILLDERGRSLSSEGFATYLDKKLQQSQRRLIFLIGGAYGFSDALYERAKDQLSLSSMTFSHQMVRLFFMEQLYRAMTILRNEPYHNA